MQKKKQRKNKKKKIKEKSKTELNGIVEEKREKKPSLNRQIA